MYFYKQMNGKGIKRGPKYKLKKSLKLVWKQSKWKKLLRIGAK